MKLTKMIALFLAIVLIPAFGTHAFAVEFAEARNNGLAVDEDIVEVIQENIPEDVFGGLYYNESGELVLKIKEETGGKTAATLGISQAEVKVEKVKYSLSELEAMKAVIEPYMISYGIVTLDANEVNNSIDIELNSVHSDIQGLLSSLKGIDLDIVNVSVLDEGDHIEYTLSDQPATTVPNEYIEFFGGQVSTAAIGAKTTIYPGMILAVDNTCFGLGNVKYGTAGPRYNSNMFFSAGHLVDGTVNNPKVFVGDISNNRQIGTVTDYLFGSSGGLDGDRANIHVSNDGQLPSSNTLGVNGGIYTLTLNSVVGAPVEMWGAYSGIKTGTVSNTNQTVNVSGVLVRGMVKASYTCKHGDSGAAVFSANAAYDPNAKCYGIQSAGYFTSGSDVASYSWYSPVEGY